MARTNLELTQELKSQVLRTPEIIEAFEKVDRASFVSTEYLAYAYTDRPLPIGAGQTISQPYTVAFMLELLEPTAGQRILDVGSGSGWTTALLGQIVGRKGKVIGLEVVTELIEFGQANLAKYDLPQAEIRLAGRSLGLAEEAPFDRILVSAAADKLPATLVDQLEIGGIMVAPVRSSVWKVIKTEPDRFEREEYPGFAFVPLRVR
ncbi:protein-L-isoaspartate(D-aspartate) O-methyltransferase [Candidatus Microgenomates bacterium]|nr:protein-L-isoaspartate(D-aspartate) O-methyltransferase [Candidatus Microgenomates bacterium]